MFGTHVKLTLQRPFQTQLVSWCLNLALGRGVGGVRQRGWVGMAAVGIAHYEMQKGKWRSTIPPWSPVLCRPVGSGREIHLIPPVKSTKNEIGETKTGTFLGSFKYGIFQASLLKVSVWLMAMALVAGLVLWLVCRQGGWGFSPGLWGSCLLRMSWRLWLEFQWASWW